MSHFLRDLLPPHLFDFNNFIYLLKLSGKSMTNRFGFIFYFKLSICLMLLVCTFAVSTHAQNSESLENKLVSLKNDTNKISQLNALTEILIKKRSFEKAMGYAKQSLKIVDSLVSFSDKNSRYFQELKKLYGFAYNNLGTIYFQQHNYDEAIRYYLSAYQAYLISGNQYGLALTLGNLGNAYNEKSDFTKASTYFLDAFDLFKLQNDTMGMANSFNNLGNMAIYQGNYPEAMKNFLVSLKLRESINDKKGIASSYNNLGNVAFYMGNYEEALKNFKISLPISESLQDKKGVANLYNAMGSVYGQLSQSENAIINFNKALTIQKEIGNKSSMSQLYNNIGVIYSEDGNYKLAFENFNESLKINETTGNKRGIGNTLSNMASNYFKQHDYKNSLSYYNQSLVLAYETGNKVTEREDYKGLSETYAAMKDFKNAFLFQSRYNDIKDSLQSSEKNSLIAEMKTRFETEKKDTEIKLLNTEKKLQEVTIEKQKTKAYYLIVGFILLAILIVVSFLFYNQGRKTKFENQVSKVEMIALRAQMNPHFIFNSLNSIYKYIQRKEPEQASEYLIKFSKLMRLILENSRFQEVSLEKDLAALTIYMQLESLRMNHRFSHEIIIAKEIDPEITMIPPLILQPFVENSIWHGLQDKKEDGKITIRISQEGSMLVCDVEDNGIGRKKAQEIKTSSSAQKGESLGMKITNSRIEIINKTKKTNGSVHITDLEAGVKVRVSIPLELSF